MKASDERKKAHDDIAERSEMYRKTTKIIQKETKNATLPRLPLTPSSRSSTFLILQEIHRNIARSYPEIAPRGEGRTRIGVVKTMRLQKDKETKTRS